MHLKSILSYAGKNIAFLGIGLAAVFLMEYFGVFVGMGHFCYDLFYRLRGPVAVSEKIVLVTVDENSLSRLGQWPIKRRHWANLLYYLQEAKVVGFDILLLEPTEDDFLLAQAAEKHGRVVFPAYITKDARTIQSTSLFTAHGTGHIHLEQDIDGVVRRVYHTLYTSGAQLSSLSSVLYESATGRVFERQGIDAASENFRSTILQSDVQLIDYYGPQGSFPVFSLDDVLAGRYPPDYFRDKIILVGVTAEGLEAGVITPLSQKRNHMSGVEAHAHILGNLIDGRRISAVSANWVWSASFILAAGFFFLMLRFQRWRVVALWMTAIIGVYLASFLAFLAGRVWLNPIPPTVLLFVAFFLAHLIRMEASAAQLTEANNLWVDSFDSIEEAIWLTDSQGAVLKRNRSAQNLLSDKRIRTVLIEGIMERIHAVMSDAGYHDEPPQEGPLTDEIIDTLTDRHFSLKVIRRCVEENSCPGFVVVVQDISGQRRANREKLNLETELMQAQKMEAIGTLAGGVAHDFNNILMGIQGYVSLLLLDIDGDDPKYEKLKKIESQIQSAAGLTRQLLGFARGGKYEVKPVDLNAVVEKSSEVFARTRKEIAVSTQYQDSVWPVMADVGQIEQVLLNMFINSWQAMPEGGDLYLKTENVLLDDTDASARAVPRGRYVKVSVTDTGSGMDEATSKRVFEPFFTTKEPGKGTGLGLASAYGILSNHGGFVEVETELGKGTAFYIYLPAADNFQSSPEPTVETMPQRGKETLLVVDDEPMNVTVMKEILESLGYRVLCAGSGQEALSIYMVKKDAVDLILLDMVMPGMGGGATFDAIRLVNPQAKIILSSGYGQDGEAGRILERGCNGFIQKPFRVSELAEQIRDVLDG